MISRKTESFTDLHIFLGVIATLIIIGFVFVFSSSSVYALEKFGSSYYFVKKQIIGFIIGLAISLSSLRQVSSLLTHVLHERL